MEQTLNVKIPIPINFDVNDVAVLCNALRDCANNFGCDDMGVHLVIGKDTTSQSLI